MVASGLSPTSDLQSSSDYEILIVEDHKLQSEFLTYQLQNAFRGKVNVMCADNGYDAIHHIFSDQKTDLIISDCNLNKTKPLITAYNVPPDLQRAILYFKTRDLSEGQLIHQIELISKGSNRETIAALIIGVAKEGLLDLSNGFTVAKLTQLFIGNQIDIVMMSANADNKNRSHSYGFENFFVKSAANLQTMTGKVKGILDSRVSKKP